MLGDVLPVRRDAMNADDLETVILAALGILLTVAAWAGVLP